MFRKQILHFITVSMKFFFDFDANSSQQLFSMAQLFSTAAKLGLIFSVAYFYQGLITVKQDVLAIKSDARSLAGRWENSHLRELILDGSRAIRSILLEDTRTLCLKLSHLRIEK
jgi:hypothetical protein